MSAIKKSISMPVDLWERMQPRLKDLGYSNPSAYLQQLVREDLLRRGAHVRGLELAETASIAEIKNEQEPHREKKDPFPMSYGKLGHANSNSSKPKDKPDMKALRRAVNPFLRAGHKSPAMPPTTPSTESPDPADSESQNPPESGPSNP